MEPEYPQMPTSPKNLSRRSHMEFLDAVASIDLANK